MAIKKNGVGCYDKASMDEPLFCLRARDQTAPQVVRYWAVLAEQDGVNAMKVREARACASEMEQWQIRHGKRLAD